MKKLTAYLLISVSVLTLCIGCKNNSSDSSGKETVSVTPDTAETVTGSDPAETDTGETQTSSENTDTTAGSVSLPAVSEPAVTNPDTTAASVSLPAVSEPESTNPDTTAGSVPLPAVSEPESTTDTAQSERVTVSSDENQTTVTVIIADRDKTAATTAEPSEITIQDTGDGGIIVNDDGSVILPFIPIEQLEID